MPRFWGYGRGSTDEQTETLDAQEFRIKKEWECRYQEYAWGGVFLDAGVSGRRQLQRRPEGVKLLAEIEPGDVLCITKLDRGFRSTKDFLEMLDYFDAKKVRLAILDLALDTGTPVGRLMATMLAAIAEFERSRICERTREVNESRRRKGLPTGQAYWGWRNCGRQRGKKSLMRDDECRTWAGKCLDWYELGWSIEDIWRHLLISKAKRLNGAEFSKSWITRAVQFERIQRALEASGIYYPVSIARMLQEEKLKQRGGRP